MKAITRNYQLEIIPFDLEAINLLRTLIIAYVRKYRFFASYSYLAKVTGWSQPVLWRHLDAMGDEDVLNGRPRMDAFVGNDEPSNGHFTKKQYSGAHRTRWERIQYLNVEIGRLCNYYRLEFLQKVVLSSGVEKFFLRTTGMWYENRFQDRQPVKRIQEKEKTLSNMGSKTRIVK